MRRVYPFARGSEVGAGPLNRIQDEQLGLVRATGSAGPLLTGADGRHWTTGGSGLADATIAVVDASVDWRDRRLHGVFLRLAAANQRTGQSAAWQRNDLTATYGIATRPLHDAVTRSGAAVTAGVTPTLGSGVPVAVLDDVPGGRVYLYARSTDGALCLYNSTGGLLHAELEVYGSREAPSSGTAPGVPSYLAGDVETTDATWTTVPGCVASLAVSSVVTFRGTVSAIRDNGTEGAAFTFEAAFRRGASGAPVPVGADLFLLVARDDAAFDARIQVVSNDVVVQVHGAASKTMTWRVEIDTTEARIG